MFKTLEMIQKLSTVCYICKMKVEQQQSALTEQINVCITIFAIS